MRNNIAATSLLAVAFSAATAAASPLLLARQASNATNTTTNTTSTTSGGSNGTNSTTNSSLPVFPVGIAPALYDGNCTYAAPQPGFNASRYVGSSENGTDRPVWYQIAAQIQPFSSGCSCVYARYGTFENGSVSVENFCARGNSNTAVSSIKGRADPLAQYGNGSLKVTFGPFTTSPDECSGPNYIVQKFYLANETALSADSNVTDSSSNSTSSNVTALSVFYDTANSSSDQTDLASLCAAYNNESSTETTVPSLTNSTSSTTSSALPLASDLPIIVNGTNSTNSTSPSQTDEEAYETVIVGSASFDGWFLLSKTREWSQDKIELYLRDVALFGNNLSVPYEITRQAGCSTVLDVDGGSE